MQLYLIVILSFLVVNFLLSIFLKKYTFFKFFVFVIVYFTLINLINLIYFRNIDFFAFQTLFFVTLLFLYVGLYSSVSVKIMIYLYFKKVGVNVNSFYETEFKQKSFNKRINNLINNGLLVKKNKYLELSKSGKKYLKIFKIIHLIYRVKISG
tara:strand:- start:478 stop:936 length:459 start_codon:yes stop_codon:yes gene_type:complete